MANRKKYRIKMTMGYNKPIEWLFSEKYRWLYHVLFWSVIYADEWLSMIGVTESMQHDWRTAAGFLLDVGMVYFIIYLVLPRYLLQGKHGLFLLIAVQITIVNSLLQLFIRVADADYFSNSLDYILTDFIYWFVNTLLIIGVAVGFKIFKSFIRNEIRLNEMENENLRTELTYLKNQINPHFLFNSLNNIYVLNRKNPATASESILLLSDLLRYQLYDCVKERVLLKDEVDYIRNFLDLDKLRKENADIRLEVQGVSNQKIAPFIFLPFVENAIKHGSSVNNESSYIAVSIKCPTSENLVFMVENSKPKLPLITETGGIGLTNLKRRLEILYEDKHSLETENTDKFYRITLKLNLA